VAIGFLIGWVAVTILPRAIVRGVLAAMATPISVNGGERLASAKAVLVIRATRTS